MTTFRRVVLNLSTLKDTIESIKKVKLAHDKLYTVETHLNTVRKKIRSKYIVPMMRHIREYPRTRRYPEDYGIEWTSDKQRKYVMGYVLKGSSHKRTHKLQKGWNYRIVIKNNSKLTIELKNDVDYYQFVVGKYGTGISNRSIRRYIKPMQRFHAITGWNPVYQYTNKYINKAKEEGTAMIEKWMDSLFI